MALVTIDLDKLKLLCEDRGMSIAALMELLGLKSLGKKIPAELKLKIWQILETRAHAAKIAEVKRYFPNAQIEKIS